MSTLYPDGGTVIIAHRLKCIGSTPDCYCPSSAGQFAENETNEVNFREIPSHVLSKVCMYFTYKVRYTNSSTEIPEFPIAPEIALELLMAANFLDC